MARQMKDSGVEWIGEIPEEWDIVQARRYVSVNHGSDPKTPGSIPVYGSGSISFKTCGEYKEGPTVLLGRKGTLNAPQYITGKYWNVDTAFDVAVTDDIALRFYYYLATCFDYMYYSSQTAVPSMTQSNYLSMRLPVPHINVQNCIVNLLNTKCFEIDKVVEQTRATIEEYKKLKQAIITEAVTKGVRGPRPMKPSGVEWIGDIPEEWTVSNLGKVTSSMRNGYVGPTRDLFVDDGVRYIQSLHIKDGKIDLSKKAYFVRPEWAAERPKVSTGDVLIVQTGDIGQVGLVTEEYHECSCHALIIASPNKSDISSEYLAYFLRSTVGRELLLAHKTGALLPHLNSGKIRFAEVVHPNTIEEQKETTAYLDTKCAEINRIIEKKEQLIEELGSYKKSLIYECVTGKREIKIHNYSQNAIC